MQIGKIGHCLGLMLSMIFFVSMVNCQRYSIQNEQLNNNAIFNMMANNDSAFFKALGNKKPFAIPLSDTVQIKDSLTAFKNRLNMFMRSGGLCGKDWPYLGF